MLQMISDSAILSPCWRQNYILGLAFGRPFVKLFALCYGTVVLSVCLCVCNVGVLWPNGWTDQDATWYGDRPRARPHCVRWGPSSRTETGTAALLFGPRLLWPNGRPCQQLLSSCSTCHIWIKDGEICVLLLPDKRVEADIWVGFISRSNKYRNASF